MDTTIPARCSHFPLCGGCAYQDLPYPQGQIGQKEEVLKRLFGFSVPVADSPIAFEYRNRMDFVCAFGKIGLRERGKFYKVVDIEHCHLVHPKVSEALRAIREWLRQGDIKDHDYLKHMGYLRYIVCRVTQFTDDLMISFVTANEEPHIVPIMEKTCSIATSVNWLVNDTLSETSFGRIVQSMGKGYFTEKIGGLLYRAGPNTFFQNNAHVAGKILEHITPFVSGNVADLFCGVGTLSLVLASHCIHVTGVESEAESIRFAHENARENNVANCSFVCSPVKEWLATTTESFDTFVCDPPRSGMGNKIIKKILKLAPQSIVYVSCNPKSFADDMRFFSDAYALQDLQGFDMFPQTPHVELAALFKRN
ncbi:MAG: 23S rRNA (uracil-5-)-methyltransferase RumA [Candidatus Raymondbacteria bacterium RifOxyA12_full_50_37]|uniref:23S rRNA (Uracil-5-)-methyltransferase RumA n=1 Tax=Candidatus Raymondbacteria bacterium RIFOXYD12_FULL_49_13 TaxID=1817890 RepID=A0A1F7FG52_UNCRA|nr:MAG: 23S rRNA (uracil-5-)-methyltransferase RumA [Candidatus Raymondbacteria bacterium RifOxyB12_full_50_8]OGJ91619.1 MAG: 23S rRNA (uracil-5-)-methyltransferase RumA [Candidatus Raymondbacteria bacterium RifOxyA12_full_50_37]OGJ92925.1 MAG: 23S rRNA (uracil-5-)-methyltransferase RumA [Candidatus Raymondbacteria bacterium RIFOXYA2_FULL_49_16]OGJ94851.1 MAG: 23S rRNA (uracil-5-)-methyltransferase RumA [Candidatus Raymondbacteria bacterium RifOxyC12_full_50_8]OGK05689.1 MAG: 23S rRNA (uracil-5